MKKLLQKFFTENELKGLVNSPPYGYSLQVNGLICILSFAFCIMVLSESKYNLLASIFVVILFMGIIIAGIIGQRSNNLLTNTKIYAIQLFMSSILPQLAACFSLHFLGLSAWLGLGPGIFLGAFILSTLLMKRHYRRKALGKKTIGQLEMILILMICGYLACSMAAKFMDEFIKDLYWIGTFYLLSCFLSCSSIFIVKYFSLKYFEKEYITEETKIKVASMDRLNLNKFGM